MKKLFSAFFLAFLSLFVSSAKAQLPPNGIYVMQADSAGQYFWGRYFTPSVATDSYFLMYDGGTGMPKMGALGSALSWNGTTLDIGSLSQSQVTGLVSSLAGKFSIPTCPVTQYIRGDGTCATLPTAPSINYSLPAARTVAVTTSYQATDPTKPAIISISPQCTAAMTISGGSTCSLDLRVHSTTATCSNGTVTATWTNGNTGTLTIGLALNQLVGSPYSLNLPISGRFILCATSGTWTIQAAEQSVG